VVFPASAAATAAAWQQLAAFDPVFLQPDGALQDKQVRCLWLQRSACR
jgi:hypothetical protein